MKNYEPLVHIITNSVTINDTVNFVLASGATAICADSPREAAEITSIADALMINIGMPSDVKLEAMISAGRRANERQIPVVLDPVGAGASSYRKEILNKLLQEVNFSCIRGNKAEFAALTETPFVSKGVEGVEISICDGIIHKLSAETGAVVVMSGETDVIADDKDKFEVTGGSPIIRKVTGSGCMYSAFLAARLAMSDDISKVKTIRKAASDYKLNSIRAEQLMRARGLYGTASFRGCLIDAMSIESLGGYWHEIG